jgi:hypothetical protein
MTGSGLQPPVHLILIRPVVFRVRRVVARASEAMARTESHGFSVDNWSSWGRSSGRDHGKKGTVPPRGRFYRTVKPTLACGSLLPLWVPLIYRPNAERLTTTRGHGWTRMAFPLPL